MKLIKYQNNWLNVNSINSIKLQEEFDSHEIYTGCSISIFAGTSKYFNDLHIKSPLQVDTNIQKGMDEYDKQMTEAKTKEKQEKIDFIDIIQKDKKFNLKMKINDNGMKELCENIVKFVNDDTIQGICNVDNAIDEMKKTYQTKVKEIEPENKNNIKNENKPINKAIKPKTP